MNRAHQQRADFPTLPDVAQKPYQRKVRIEQLLRRELSELMRREMNEPLLAMAAITKVDLSPDLKRAKILISITGDSAVRHTVFRALNRAEGYLRAQLGHRLENLKVVPHLTFEPDLSIEYSVAMSAKIEGLHIPPAKEEDTDE